MAPTPIVQVACHSIPQDSISSEEICFEKRTGQINQCQLNDTGLRMQPSTPLGQMRRSLSALNFRNDSQVDVLCVTNENKVWMSDQSDEQIACLLKGLDQHDCGKPSLIAFIIFLDGLEGGVFGLKSGMSLKIVQRVFRQFNVHDTFLHNMLGRPDYWSTVQSIKDTDHGRASAYEFLCQHPRWAQRGRYDKSSHRVPCSVYMHHSKPENISVYLITASRNDNWIKALRKQLELDGQNNQSAQGNSSSIAECPFALHAIISGIAFEQSIDYVASVREKLMGQIARVNDYSEDSSRKRVKFQGTFHGRLQLENITKELHLVSQTADTGIANSHMHIKICEDMLQAHHSFYNPADPAKMSVVARQTGDSLRYLLKSMHCQRDWLVTYKARKDTAMNFVFNMVTQQDSAVNMDISYKMSKDSSSMNAITILTMIFLPGTFLSSLFSSGIFKESDSGPVRTTPLLTPFIVVALLLTFVTLFIWYFSIRAKRWVERLVKSGSSDEGLSIDLVQVV